MSNLIRRPIITEKAMKLTEKGQYVFEVDPNANKIEIKKEIQEMFEVDIISCRTVRIKGKIRSRITKSGVMKGRTPLRKKAYITLKEGQSIDLVTGGAANV